MMRNKLLILLSLCCFCGAMTMSYAADDAAKIAAKKAAEAERKAKIEAEKKAEAERKAKIAAEKKQRELAERKAREEARKNDQTAKRLADQFRSAMRAEKFDEAATVSKDALAMIGKPGVPDINWFVRSFTSYDLGKAKAPVRAKAIPVLMSNYKAFLPKVEGDQKATLLEAYMGVLKFNLPASEKELAQVKADRYKVAGITPQKTMQLYIADWEFEKADKVAASMKLDDPEKGLAEIVSAFRASGIPGCQYTKKWFEKWVAVPATGDTKYAKLSAYANFLEEYALASMEEVDKIRQDLDKINDLTPEFQFKNACSRLNGKDTDAVYQANLDKAMTLAKNDVQLRVKVYTLATAEATHWGSTAIPDDAKLKDFLLNVVFKDREAMANVGFAGTALKAYVRVNFMNYQETETFLLKFRNEENKFAVNSALLSLYKIAAVRYYNGTNVTMARKILALYQESLKDLEEKVAKEKNAKRKGDLELSVRKSVVEWAFLADDLKTVRENIATLEPYAETNANVMDYVCAIKAKLAYMDENYAEVVKLLLPQLNKEGKRNWPPESYEHLIRSLVATGDVKQAAEIMEKHFNDLPYWTRRNYYKPRLEELKKRAETQSPQK